MAPARYKVQFTASAELHDNGDVFRLGRLLLEFRMAGTAISTETEGSG